jgi:translation initiation factor 4B
LYFYSLGPDIDINKVPTQPPFICYLSNLSFEATEEDIHKFFKDLKLIRVEITKETGSNNRMRGQCVCEFPDRQSLIEAFTFNQEPIRARPVKLSLSSYEQGKSSVIFNNLLRNKKR